MKLIDIISEEMNNIKDEISESILNEDSINKANVVDINTLYTSVNNKLTVLSSISTYDKWISFVMDLFDLLILKSKIFSNASSEESETEHAVSTVAHTYKSIMRKMDVEFESNYTYIYMLMILLYIKSENSPEFLEMDIIGDIDKILIHIANKFANISNTYLKIYTLSAIFMLIRNKDSIRIKISDIQIMQELVAELVKAQEDNSSVSSKVKQKIKRN